MGSKAIKVVIFVVCLVFTASVTIVQVNCDISTVKMRGDVSAGRPSVTLARDRILNNMRDELENGILQPDKRGTDPAWSIFLERDSIIRKNRNVSEYDIYELQRRISEYQQQLDMLSRLYTAQHDIISAIIGGSTTRLTPEQEKNLRRILAENGLNVSPEASTQKEREYWAEKQKTHLLELVDTYRTEIALGKRHELQIPRWVQPFMKDGMKDLVKRLDPLELNKLIEGLQRGDYKSIEDYFNQNQDNTGDNNDNDSYNNDISNLFNDNFDDPFDIYTDLDREIPDPDTGIAVHKPNIYIYSKEDRTVNVRVYPTNYLTRTIPLYDSSTGWNARVFNGSINGRDDFLFYEAMVPDEGFQKEKGWIIRQKSLEEDMEKILDMYRFNDVEKKDFLEYWVEKLKGSGNFVFYPQDKEAIDRLMPLVITPPAEKVYRVWFYIEPKGNIIPGKVRGLVPVDRTDYCIIEWGGMMK